MTQAEPETPLSLLLPLGVLALLHALALALGTGAGPGPAGSFGAWGRVNITAAMLAVVAFALILKRHRDGKPRPNLPTLAWAVAAADLGALVVAAAVLRPWA
jgi:hypothetical protein